MGQVEQDMENDEQRALGNVMREKRRSVFLWLVSVAALAWISLKHVHNMDDFTYFWFAFLLGNSCLRLELAWAAWRGLKLGWRQLFGGK